MRNLKLQKLYLLSRLEGKARTETFDNEVTVVFGENDTGKSHLLKSIYSAFGADSQVVNPKWQQGSVTLLLEISVDDNRYTIVREGNQIGLFDADAKMLWTSSHLTKEIGPKIAKLLDFKIKLPTKSDDLITPPAQFAFLPFYQDQDRGWNDSWSSFKGLGMISGYRLSVLEYHTGIKPKEYYVAQAEKALAVHEQNELKAERRALDRAVERLQADRPALSITFNPELFANQIEQLLAELNELRSIYDGVRKKLSELQSRRAVLVEEIEIATAALGELDADFKFMRGIDDTEVICPTCNTVHENSFANRFSLIDDADACRGFLASAKHSLGEVDGDIDRQKANLQKYTGRVDKINSILDQSREDIKLRDMLDQESERILDFNIAAERSEIDLGIAKFKVAEDDATESMKQYSNAKRKAEIIKFYSEKLRKFAWELGIEFSEACGKSVAPKINETGSYGPRAILAYHFAILHTINEFTTTCLCPVILDTPLQQDQDEANAKAIISFALKNRPPAMQLILGSVSMHGVLFDGHVINPTVKESLLSETEFVATNDFIRPFLNKMYGQDQAELF